MAGQVYRLRVESGSAAASKLKIVGGLVLGGEGANLGGCPHVNVEDGIQRVEKAASDADVAIICTGISVSIN
jgi:beta-glucosidase